MVETIVGNELAMQNKLNLSFQMPNDKNSQLPMHSDIYAGESPFQVVVWIPLVNASSTKSMFITSPRYNKRLNDIVLKTNNLTTRDIYRKNNMIISANFHLLILYLIIL